MSSIPNVPTRACQHCTAMIAEVKGKWVAVRTSEPTCDGGMITHKPMPTIEVTR